MNVTINRQKLGLEDLEIGTGTVIQTRGGVEVPITQIKVKDLPYDEGVTLGDTVLLVEGYKDAAAISAAEAFVSETNSGNSAEAANTSASNASASELDASISANDANISKDEAAASAANAASSATTATTKASEASASATSASASASTATTKASEASASATSASSSATSASNSASSASSSASSASASASTATTKATEASNSATSASNSATSASSSANTATAQASIATTKANEASASATASASSASASASSATSASNSATTATTQAGIATTKAGEASASSISSATSATNSEASYQNTLAIYGSTQDVQDAVSLSTANANTSISKANEASSSAVSAASSANTATSAKDAIEAYVIPTEATYNPQIIDSKINALMPYSGYTQVSKKLDNFVFEESSSFLNKVADKNRYVKFGDVVVDTYTHTSYDATKGGVVATFQVPEVAEIITDGSNTTSVAVNAGDYVVDGSELVTNGTFDTDTGGWTLSSGYATYDSSNNSILVNNQTGFTNQAFQQSNVYILGEKNIVTYTVSNYVSGSIRVNFFNGSNYVYGRTVTANGTYTDVFDITLSSQRVIRFETINNTILNIDNISVKRVSDTFRAIQDAPIGTALTNTTYFEDRTSIGVTNQSLSYHAYNTVTNAYEGILTEVLFSDVSKEDLLDNSAWMSANGFSKVSQFLYSKGTYLVAPVGIWQSLNKGGYEPTLNPFGTAYFNSTIDGSGQKWYVSTTVDPNSVANCFVAISDNTPAPSYAGYLTFTGNLGTVSGRPDSKVYDICYPDQFIDVREYAKILNKDEVAMIVADKEENGVEEVVGMVYSNEGYENNGKTRWSIPSGTTVDYIAINNGTYLNSLGLYIFTEDGVSINPYKYNTVLEIVGTAYLGQRLLISVTKPILSSNTKLSNMIYGNPQFYPQVLKDRLASGVGCVGLEPVLVEN